MHSYEYKIIREDMRRLHEEVMGRVRFVRRIRTFLASPASSATLAIIFVLCASIFVSFGDIVHNIMAHNAWSGRFTYTYNSIVSARIVVQIFAVLTSVSLMIFSVKILIKLRTPVYTLGNYLVSRSPMKIFRSQV